MYENLAFPNEEPWNKVSKFHKTIKHKTLSNEIKSVSWRENIVYFTQGHK